MKKGSVKSHPQGHIVGATLTFPLPVDGGGTRMVAVPIQARIMRAVVDDPLDPEHWATPYIGKVRTVIECKFNVANVKETFYLDAEGDKDILWKITHGQGNPGVGGIRQLPIKYQVNDPNIHAFYRIDYTGINPVTGQRTYRLVHGGRAV